MSHTKPALREGESQSVKASTCRTHKEEEIKVLLINDKVPQTIYTMRVSSPCREIDILYKIFSNYQILNNHLGSNEIMANQSVIKVTSLNSDHQYMLEAMTPSISYKVRMTAVENSSYHYSIEIQSPVTKPHQFNYFENVFNSKTFSDVKLCVGDRELFAHKVILANRSPVFAALLDSNDNRIDIKDISYDTLFSLLHFIYNGVLCDYGSKDQFFEFSNLLKADALFFIEGLKELCEEKLSLLLTIENAVDCLILADANGAAKLEQQAIAFITENAEQIAKLSSFEKLAMLHHDKLMKVLKSSIKKESNV